MNLIGRFFGWYMQRGSKDISIAELTTALEESKDEVADKIRQGNGTQDNRLQACHVIGLERWGQRRLEILLGEPEVSDEMDPYCPASDTSMSDLAETFEATRDDTLAIVERLRESSVAPDAEAPHNDMGDLSLRAWLFYLNGHALREAGRVKA